MITGAASGLGRGIASALSAAGCHIMLADIDGPALAETHAQIEESGGHAKSRETDVSDPDEVAALFAKIDDEGLPVDFLVNAAFSHRHTPPEEIPYDRWQTTIAVSLGSYFLCCQAAGRRMIARQRGGSIVNLGSIAGSSALGRGNLAYSAAKGGVNMLTKEFAVEWGRYGIRVNALLPCQFRTPALQRWLDEPTAETDALVSRFLGGIPLGRLGEVEDIVGPALFLLSDAASMVTGTCLPVDGGNLALNGAGGDSTV